VHSRVPFAPSVAPDSSFLFSIPFDLRPRSAATLQPHRFIAKKVPSRAFQPIKKKRKEGYTHAKNKQRDKQPATVGSVGKFNAHKNVFEIAVLPLNEQRNCPRMSTSVVPH